MKPLHAQWITNDIMYINNYPDLKVKNNNIGRMESFRNIKYLDKRFDLVFWGFHWLILRYQSIWSRRSGFKLYVICKFCIWRVSRKKRVFAATDDVNNDGEFLPAAIRSDESAEEENDGEIMDNKKRLWTTKLNLMQQILC